MEATSSLWSNAMWRNAKHRWEYCELIYIGSSEEEYRLNFYATSGGLNYAIKAADRGRTIAQLGIDGWELVASSIQESHETLYFKRRLS